MKQPVRRVEDASQEWVAVWHLDPETGEVVYDQPLTEIIETTGVEVEPDEEAVSRAREAARLRVPAGCG